MTMFNTLSPKQAEIFKFPHQPQYDALICDGAVRSGKTFMMTTSFIIWAMACFNGSAFGICGKTVQSAERNIVMPLISTKSMTDAYSITYTRSGQHKITVSDGKSQNVFYIFGGKDESSYMLLQGVTLSGVMLDEVALMPQSFVEQAIARTLSIDNAKLWFNCNPESPEHWFYKEWILKPEKHRAKHLHFLMTDNPGNSGKALERAEDSFSGVFYDRYVLGKWVVAEGLIYPMFDRLKHIFTDKDAPQSGEWFISMDYGISNPFAAGLWSYSGGVAYLVDEYYHDGRTKGQRTDEEHADAVQALAGKRFVRKYVIDPSAASMVACLRKRGLGQRLVAANNDVLPGISNVASALKQGRMMFSERCKNTIREFGLYSWDEKSTDDKPIKENDHAMDEVRYFARTILRKLLPAIDIEVKK